MKYLKRLFENELLLFLLNAVIIHILFVAVVLTIYQGSPEVLTENHGLQIVLSVFEG